MIQAQSVASSRCHTGKTNSPPDTGDSTGHLNATASQQATIVSILSAGTFFGALTAAPVADLIGRRLGLVASTFVFIFGVILQTAATAIPLFVAGRFFAGFGVGLISAMS
jgi:SP family sugar:H+ symporter-like MFS transporter